MNICKKMIAHQNYPPFYGELKQLSKVLQLYHLNILSIYSFRGKRIPYVESCNQKSLMQGEKCRLSKKNRLVSVLNVSTSYKLRQVFVGPPCLGMYILYNTQRVSQSEFITPCSCNHQWNQFHVFMEGRCNKLI